MGLSSEEAIFFFQGDRAWAEHVAGRTPDCTGCHDGETPGAYAVYRMFGRAGELLYAGRSYSPLERQRAHQRDKAWYPQVKVVTLEWHASHECAAARELHVIRTEGPRHNIKGKAGGHHGERK